LLEPGHFLLAARCQLERAHYLQEPERCRLVLEYQPPALAHYQALVERPKWKACRVHRLLEQVY
jgi:hypothetical protein